MYLINISLKPSDLSAAEQEAQFNQHRAWFANYFNKGNFLLLGPYLDKEMAGLIIAKADSRAALDKILAEDVYYPDLADYEIREFKASMAAEKILAD
ncbi:MAG: YciI family protein [Moraxella sp.]|nr:YciI family protein [Moraxella sp.]